MDKISNKWESIQWEKLTEKKSYLEKQKQVQTLKELKFQKIISRRLFAVRA